MAENNQQDLFKTIVQKADIVEVASHYLKLTKKGNNYTALCPFHNDKSLGSFYINQEKQIFKCFSCGMAGNALNFIKEIENISWKEAAVKLCEVAGIDEPELRNSIVTKTVSEDIKQIYDCLQALSDFYVLSLKQSEDGAEALEYLHKRGLSDEIIDYFKIGYAQKRGENAINFLTSKGFSLKTIEEAGIASLNSEHIKDFNYDRVIFPITNEEGKIVGFSGRTLKNDGLEAKYINTKETKVFVKSKIIYNYSNAIKEARKFKYVYLVEGFMDVIALNRVGITSAIAIMGTAFTQNHLQLLRYLNVEVRICLDLDRPGQENMVKIIELFEKGNIQYKIVDNTVTFNEKDPDDILNKHGANVLKEYLNTLVSKGDWYFNFYTHGLDLKTSSGKRDFFLAYSKILLETNDEFYRSSYIDKVINVTGYSKQTILNYLKKQKEATKIENTSEVNDYDPTLFRNKRNNVPVVIDRLTRIQKRIIELMLENPEAYNLFSEKVDYLPVKDYRAIANIIGEFAVSNMSKSSDGLKDIISYVNNYYQDDSDFAKEIISMIISIDSERNDSDPKYTELEFNDLIEKLKENKEYKRLKDAYLLASVGKTEEEKALLVKSYATKYKDQIIENDKKRRPKNGHK